MLRVSGLVEPVRMPGSWWWNAGQLDKWRAARQAWRRGLGGWSLSLCTHGRSGTSPAACRLPFSAGTLNWNTLDKELWRSPEFRKILLEFVDSLWLREIQRNSMDFWNWPSDVQLGGDRPSVVELGGNRPSVVELVDNGPSVVELGGNRPSVAPYLIYKVWWERMEKWWRGGRDWYGLVRERQGALLACLTGVAPPCRVSDRGKTKSTQGHYSS